MSLAVLLPRSGDDAVVVGFSWLFFCLTSRGETRRHSVESAVRVMGETTHRHLPTYLCLLSTHRHLPVFAVIVGVSLFATRINIASVVLDERSSPYCVSSAGFIS